MEKVLVVDDSTVARRLLKEIILSLGYKVVGEAANGAQAFAEYVRLKPDLVTMDLGMEGLSGAQVISKIVATNPEARIVVVSASEERSVIIDALERGARHFIVKPIEKEKVAAVFNKVLHQPFDVLQHQERVRRLKGAAKDVTIVGNDPYCACVPPYAICAQDKRLIYVTLNSCLTLTSWQSLETELTEHLQEKVRLLLDFGMTVKLDDVLLEQINRLIAKVEEQSGQVRAVSGSKHFVELIGLWQSTNTPNRLEDILQYNDR